MSACVGPETSPPDVPVKVASLAAVRDFDQSVFCAIPRAAVFACTARRARTSGPTMTFDHGPQPQTWLRTLNADRPPAGERPKPSGER